MKVLFIHQNFPGQFVHLSAALAQEKGNRVVALTMRNNPAPKGVEVRPYTLLRQPVPETHPLLKDEEAKVLRAEGCASAAFRLKNDGFEPDVIVAHPGWGEALFIKDVFPKAKLVVYCEYYYAAEGQDVGFDPEFPPITFAQRCQIRLKNTINLHSLEMADAAISPTQWQKSTYPKWAQDKISVIHDGIDFERVRHNPNAVVHVPANQYHSGVTLKYGDEVLTYVARNLEPVRGFHVFMRTLPEVLRCRPNAHVLIVGGDDVSYGQRAPGGISWKQHMLTEVGDRLDMRRVHFLGWVPYQIYLDVLHVSKVHAYWTTPFVLSWSFLEAAAAGCNLLASHTTPVIEFRENISFAMAEFFDTDRWAANLIHHLQDALPARRGDAVLPLIGGSLDIATCRASWQNLLSNFNTKTLRTGNGTSDYQTSGQNS